MADHANFDDYHLIYVSGTAVPGQNNTFIPHKGVLSPAEKALYISYSDGAGPYDGTTVTSSSDGIKLLLTEYTGKRLQV